jgi:hypothetical protein
MNKSHHHIGAVLLLLLLSGCGIGLAPWGDKQETFEHPYMFVFRTKGSLESGSPRVKDLVKNLKNITDAKEIKQHWGEPDERVQLDDKTERWEYSLDGWRWHGAMLHILVPIPVLIPFGHDYVTLVFQEGQVTSGTKVDSAPRKGFFCGFLPLDSPAAKSLWPCGKMEIW